jgi:hypothetical protein
MVKKVTAFYCHVYRSQSPSLIFNQMNPIHALKRPYPISSSYILILCFHVLLFENRVLRRIFGPNRDDVT